MFITAIWLDLFAAPVTQKNYVDNILAAYYLDHKFVIEYND